MSVQEINHAHSINTGDDDRSAQKRQKPSENQMKSFKHQIILINRSRIRAEVLISTSSSCYCREQSCFSYSPLLSWLAPIFCLLWSCGNFFRPPACCSPETIKIELINWSLSAIDKIFTHVLHRVSRTVPVDHSLQATLATRGRPGKRFVWMFSVEDIVDLWIIGILLVGFLIVRLEISLIYRKIGKTAASKFTQKLS